MAHGLIHGSSLRAAARAVRPSGERKSRRRYGAAQLRSGLDGNGRFIGPQDLDRAWQHFWNVPHRKPQAPIVRDFDCRGSGSSDVPAEAAAITVPNGNLGRPRASKHGLTADILLQMHARRGEGPTALAKAFNVPVAAVYYHLKPSVAMRCALAGLSVTVP